MWTDFGLGFDEEARRRAMKEALVDAGLTVMSRAGREGFAAFAPGAASFIDGYRQNLGRMDQDRRQAREDELEEEYRQARIADLDNRRLEREGEETSKQAEIQSRKEAIARIADDKVRGELELRVGQPDFWKVYDARTAPPKEPKAPEVRNFEDGTTRQWDPVAGDWKVLARKAPKESSGEDGGDFSKIMSAADKAVAESRKAALARADKEIAAIQKQNAEETAPPVKVPDRFALAKKYELEELESARYRAGLPGTKERPSFSKTSAPPPSSKPAAGPPAKAAAADVSALTSTVDQVVGRLSLPPEVAGLRKKQILARAQQLLRDGHTMEEILESLR